MTTKQLRKREYQWKDEEDDHPPKPRPSQPWEIDYYHDLAAETPHTVTVVIDPAHATPLRTIRDPGAKHDRPFQPWEYDYYHDLAAKKQKEESQEHAVSVVSPTEKCSYCNMAGHEVDACRFRILMEKAEAEAEAEADVESTPPPKCEMCNGDHVTQGCHIVAPYREPERVQGENGEIFFLIEGKLCDDYEDKYVEPKVALTLTRKQCRICYEEHKGICRYAKAVEKGALISPFFPIICRECDEVLDNGFWCTQCNKEMIGHVTVCRLCKVCGKLDMSPNCCPYGRLVFDNFRRSHPSGNGKLWPLLEDDI